MEGYKCPGDRDDGEACFYRVDRIGEYCRDHAYLRPGSHLKRCAGLGVKGKRCGLILSKLKVGMESDYCRRHKDQESKAEVRQLGEEIAADLAAASGEE
jgi:hypothetical protein